MSLRTHVGLLIANVLAAHLGENRAPVEGDTSGLLEYHSPRRKAKPAYDEEAAKRLRAERAERKRLSFERQKKAR